MAKKRSRRTGRTRARKSTVVSINLPARPLKYADAMFMVRADGRTTGELRISHGGLDWYPRSAKHAVSMTWERFAKLLDENR